MPDKPTIRWEHGAAGVPLSELQFLLAMFDRAGIRYQRFDKNDGTSTVDVSPERPADDSDGLYATEGPLTGEPWAETTYSFDATGNLTHIHMSGE